MTRAATSMLAIALMGCFSRAPESQIVLRGRVVSSTGEPVGGATVTVLSVECPATDYFRDPPELLPDPDWRAAGAAETHASGEYALSLYLVERENRCVVLRTSAGEGAPGAELRLPDREIPQALPDLVLWQDAVLRAAGDSGGPPSFTLPAAPWSPPQEAYSWRLVAPGGFVAWQQVWDGQPIVIPPHLSEDFALGLRGEARGGLLVPAEPQLYPIGPSQPVMVTFRSWTGSIPLAHDPFVPASRGAACTTVEKPLPGCELTNGALQTVDLLDDSSPPRSYGPEDAKELLRLDFQRDVTPRRLVLRGGLLAAEYAQVSSDGETWTRLGSESESLRCEAFCDRELPASGAARFLRLIGQRGVGSNRLTEVSVFE